jgi:tight adherence protein C
MLSDVTRGLIGILRGDETQMYWISLSLKLADAQRQMLKQQALKVPGKIKRLSMALLFCFIATYVVVLGMQIMSSLGALF